MSGRLLALCAKAQYIDRNPLGEKAAGKHLLYRATAAELDQFSFTDVSNTAALRTNQMMMEMAVHLHAQRAVMGADFAQNTAREKNMDVFVYRCQRDSRNQLLHRDEDLFRTRMAVHGLHDFIDHLTLMRHRQPLLSA